MTQKDQLDRVNLILREVVYDRSKYCVKAYPAELEPKCLEICVSTKRLNPETGLWTNNSDGIVPEDFSPKEFFDVMQAKIDKMIREIEDLPPPTEQELKMLGNLRNEIECGEVS